MLTGVTSLELQANKHKPKPAMVAEVYTLALLKIIDLISKSAYLPGETVEERYAKILPVIAAKNINYSLKLSEFICIEEQLTAINAGAVEKLAAQCAAPTPLAIQPAKQKKPLLTTNGRLAVDLGLMLVATQTGIGNIPPLNNYAARKFLTDFYAKCGVTDATPNKKLALDMGVSLASLYLNPQAYAQYTAGKGLEDILKTITPNHVMLAKNVITLLLVLTSYNPRALISTLLPWLVAQYGPVVYLAAPLAALIYQQGPKATQTLYSDNFMTAAEDFFDLIHGQAQETTAAKFQPHWAWQDLGTLAAEVAVPIKNGLFWLGNKVASKMTSNKMAALPDREAQTAVQIGKKPISL